MKLSSSFQVLLALSLTLAADAGIVRRSSHVVKESVQAPSSWTRRGDAPDHQPLALRFALKQSDVSSLEKRLRQTSDPDHPSYGQHLSAEEVSAYLQPSKRAVEEVEMWLRDAGVHIDEDLAERSHSKDTFSVHVPVWQARELLNADLSIYEHQSSGHLAVRTQQYSVPQHISEHLDYVGPLTLFTEPRANVQEAPLRKRTVSSVLDAANATQHGGPASCNPEAVTSQCLRDYYNTTSYVPKAADRQFYGISGFLEQYANFSDFDQFLKLQRPDAYEARFNFTVQSIGGGLYNSSDPGDEADPDVQIAAGISFPIPFTFYTTPGRAPVLPDVHHGSNEPYELQLNYLLKLPSHQLPSVLATSYGDNEQTVPRAYAERVCNLIMALGARGVSMLYSSGDHGVGRNGTCISNGNVSKNGTAMFLPSFPTTCPYATAVGATKYFAPEVVASDRGFVSGSGFSDYFARPWYQKKQVSSYLKEIGSQHKGLYNRHGRAYPDIAVQGYNYVTRHLGANVPVQGTSMSVPAFAGIVALLNDVRLSQGKPTLGFLNPMIYKKWLGTSALLDITQGNTYGCNTAGFPATDGWDAATGAGTPNFEAMKCSLEA